MAMEVLINIDVPDLDAGIAFYQRAVGLQLKRRLFGNAVAELAGARVPIFLLEKAAGSVPAPTTGQRDYWRHWTPVHFDLIVADLEPAVAQAVAAGATLEGPIADYVWGRHACLSDPFGHGFCLLEWRGGAYDELAEA